MATDSGYGAPNTAFEERDISGKTIVLTGGSRGIGFQLATELAERGATLVLVARNDEVLQKAVADLKTNTSNENIEGIAGDVGKPDDVKRLCAAIAEKYDVVHILINNASIMPGIFMGIDEVPEEHAINMVNINVTGYYLMTRYMLPLLLNAEEGWERTIVFVSSSAAFLEEPGPGIGLVGYRMTKAAENGLMVGMHQMYVDESGIGTKKGQKLHRMVSVHPGFVQTDLGEETSVLAEGETLVGKKAEMGAITVKEGADSLLWLATAARDVTSGKFYYLREIHSF